MWRLTREADAMQLLERLWRAADVVGVVAVGVADVAAIVVADVAADASGTHPHLQVSLT